MSTLTRAAALARNPRRLGAAVLRRAVPHSPTHGFPWIRQPDGSVTFHERGFVAADGPAALLARHNHETQRIRTELAGLHVRRSLEFGCGFGRLSTTFAAHSDEHIALDINAAALATARTAYPDIDFRTTTPGPLPFPDGHVGLVCSWTVVQHVRPEAIRETCAELVRVLAPGGTLLLCEETREPGEHSGHSWHRTVAEYQVLLAPLELEAHGYITEIDRIPGMSSPGEVMRFRRPEQP